MASYTLTSRLISLQNRACEIPMLHNNFFGPYLLKAPIDLNFTSWYNKQPLLCGLLVEIPKSPLHSILWNFIWNDGYKVTINKDQWFNLPKRGFVKPQICSHGSEISYDSYQKWLHSPKKLYGGYKVTINKGQWFNVPKQQRILMCNEKCIKLPVLLCLACK